MVNLSLERHIDLRKMSTQFVVKGKLPLDKFKELLAEVNQERVGFESDFGEHKVVAKRIDYKASGEFSLLLVETTV
jgi:hypothetical protein